MDNPTFGQEDQRVHEQSNVAGNQNNAARDINQYVINLSSGVDKTSSDEDLRTVLEALKKALAAPEQGKPTAPPPVAPVEQTSQQPWIVQETQGFNGVDMTGVWFNPNDQFCVPAPMPQFGYNASGPQAPGALPETCIRQFGTYLNFITICQGQTLFWGEGLINPSSMPWFVRLVGQHITGWPIEIHANLNLFGFWSLQGQQYYPSVYPYGVRFYLCKKSDGS